MAKRVLKTKEYIFTAIYEPLPYHTQFDLPCFVILNILKQTELSREEFLKLL